MPEAAEKVQAQEPARDSALESIRALELEAAGGLALVQVLEEPQGRVPALGQDPANSAEAMTLDRSRAGLLAATCIP